MIFAKKKQIFFSLSLPSFSLGENKLEPWSGSSLFLASEKEERERERKKMMTQQQYFDDDVDHDDVDDDHHVDHDHVDQVPPPCQNNIFFSPCPSLSMRIS